MKESLDSQKNTAYQRAHIAAKNLGCAPELFAPFAYDAKSDLLFTCVRGNEKIIFKAHIDNPAGIAAWHEPHYAALAAHAKLGAPVYDAAHVSGVMASQFLPGKPLQAAELREVDFEILTRAHALHEAVDASTAGIVQRDYQITCAKTRDALFTPEMRQSLGQQTVESLSRRLTYIFRMNSRLFSTPKSLSMATFILAI